MRNALTILFVANVAAILWTVVATRDITLLTLTLVLTAGILFGLMTLMENHERQVFLREERETLRQRQMDNELRAMLK